MIKEAIVKIVNKEDLTYDEAYAVMNEIMSGETTPTQNAAFLSALSTKSAKAETTEQLLGVYDEYLVEPLAQVLVSLGVKRGMVVYGMDKPDEICTKDELKGGTPAENAQITRDLLAGAKGPKRNAVLLNAGAAIYIDGKAETFEDGVKLAAEIIDSGKAAETLEKFIAVSNL